MAACGSLEHIFDKPLPETPTFLESLSPCKHIKSMKAVDGSSFTELFGKFHFKENHVHSSPESSSSSPCSSSPLPQSSPSSSSSSNSTFWAYANSTQPVIDIPKRDNSNEISSVHQEKNKSYYPSSQRKQYGHSDSFSSMNSESLSLCTEGLGFESFDDVEDLLKHDVCNKEWQHQDEGGSLVRNSHTENHRNEPKVTSRTSRGAFPPPISCIGSSGKPWVCFKSYRENGRFILKEIRIPTQEFLHACRENGRLKLQFIQSDDEILEEDEDEDEDEENVEEQNDDKQEKDRNESEGEIEEQNVETRDCNFQGSS